MCLLVLLLLVTTYRACSDLALFINTSVQNWFVKCKEKLHLNSTASITLCCLVFLLVHKFMASLWVKHICFTVMSSVAFFFKPYRNTITVDLPWRRSKDTTDCLLKLNGEVEVVQFSVHFLTRESMPIVLGNVIHLTRFL